MDLLSDPPRPVPPGDDAGPSTQHKQDDPSMAAVHLARFEFSDHGTKILLVEWHPAAVAKGNVESKTTKIAAAATTARTQDSTTTTTAAGAGLAPGSEPGKQGPTPPSSVDQPTPIDAEGDGWTISWPGKKTSLPARDNDADADADGHHHRRRRVFFLLPTDAQVPATVTISQPGYQDLQVKPLPAIFPDGLDADAGPRGVLHTIWAKKRLAELDREVKAEYKANSESVGVGMALEEKQWIEETFLQTEAERDAQQQQQLEQVGAGGVKKSPATGKLAEKLKGLKLATSPADLVPRPANTFTSGSAFSSSTQSDVAIPSRSGVPTSGATSIDSVVRDGSAASKGPAVLGQQQPLEDGEGLFALPMSPRSPEMKKSPFSTLS